MLSETQKHVVIVRANESVDIPIVSESSEEHLIEKVVDRINPYVEPSLRAIIPSIYVECIKIALTEGVSSDERRAQISEKLIGELGDPLTRELNERCDISFIPESIEGSMLEQVTKLIIRKFVEWTVGELDEKLAMEPTP